MKETLKTLTNVEVATNLMTIEKISKHYTFEKILDDLDLQFDDDIIVSDVENIVDCIVAEIQYKES